MVPGHSGALWLRGTREQDVLVGDIHWWFELQAGNVLKGRYQTFLLQQAVLMHPELSGSGPTYPTMHCGGQDSAVG